MSQKSSKGYNLRLQKPDNHQEAKLRLYNLKGEIVHREQFQYQTDLNMTSLANGIYLAAIIADEQRYVRKLSW